MCDIHIVYCPSSHNYETYQSQTRFTNFESIEVNARIEQELTSDK